MEPNDKAEETAKQEQRASRAQMTIIALIALVIMAIYLPSFIQLLGDVVSGRVTVAIIPFGNTCGAGAC